MIYELQIATAIENNNFLDEFAKRLKWVKQKGYSFHINISDNCKNAVNIIAVSLQCDHTDRIFKEKDIIYIFKHQIAEILAEHIVNDWELKFLKKEIIRSCKGMPKEDKEIIYNKAENILNKYNNNESLNLLINFGRKNRISHKILEYIDNDKLLIIEGFIKFCMPDYLREIKFAVDLAVEELKNEKEYNDFIKLLRYFVDTQIPKIYEVNLMMGDNGIFYMWDENGKKIEEKYLNYYLDDIIMDEINLDDVLISILITIAPRKIILHNTNFKNKSVKIIKSVFHDKIKICTGCDRCNRYLQGSDLQRHKKT